MRIPGRYIALLLALAAVGCRPAATPGRIGVAVHGQFRSDLEELRSLPAVSGQIRPSPTGFRLAGGESAGRSSALRRPAITPCFIADLREPQPENTSCNPATSDPVLHTLSSYLRARPVAPVTVRLLFAGDLMQHMPQVNAARTADGFDYGPVFEHLRPRFAGADVVVVNLETTLTRSRNYSGYPCFRSPAALADAMRDAGVDIAVTANNHCCDGGGEGLRTTLSELARCGILRTGTFTDSLDRAGNNPLRFTVRGIRFALLNYTYGTNGLPVPRGTHVNRIDTLAMAADLALARKGGTDCVVVCVHWGNEYELRENAAQRSLASFLRRHGADLVVGSHPHVPQPWHADREHVVLYSLGNFVSNQRQRHTDGGLIATIDATMHPGAGMEYALEVTPVWVQLPRYRILPPEAADTMRLPEAYTRFRDDFARIYNYL